MCAYSVKNQDILLFWKENSSGILKEQYEAIDLYLLREFGLEATYEIKIFLERKLSGHFFNNLKRRFNNLPKNKRNFETFESTYEKWLQNDFHFQYIPSERTNTKTTGNYLLYCKKYY